MRWWAWTLWAVAGVAAFLFVPGAVIELGLLWALMAFVVRMAPPFEDAARDPFAWVLAVAPAAAVVLTASTGLGFFLLLVPVAFVGAWYAGRRWGRQAFGMGCVAGAAFALLTIAGLWAWLFSGMGSGLEALASSMAILGVLVYGVVVTPIIVLAYGGLAALGARRAAAISA